MEPGSNRVTVGVRNVLVKQITIPFACQIQLANMVTKIHTPEGLDPPEQRGEDKSWILDQVRFGGNRHMVSGSVASC